KHFSDETLVIVRGFLVARVQRHAYVTPGAFLADHGLQFAVVLQPAAQFTGISDRPLQKFLVKAGHIVPAVHLQISRHVGAQRLLHLHFSRSAAALCAFAHGGGLRLAGATGLGRCFLRRGLGLRLLGAFLFGGALPGLCSFFLALFLFLFLLLFLLLLQFAALQQLAVPDEKFAHIAVVDPFAIVLGQCFAELLEKLVGILLRIEAGLAFFDLVQLLQHIGKGHIVA